MAAFLAATCGIGALLLSRCGVAPVWLLKGPRMILSIESRSEWIAGDRQDVARCDLRSEWTPSGWFARSGAS